MTSSGNEWWLELPDGTRRRVGSAGILIGRGPDCDLVLDDPHASRRHAIVHPTADGLTLVSLRLGLTERNAHSQAALRDGDELSFPGLTVTVRTSTKVDESTPSWVLRHSGGGVFGVDARGLSVGSGPDDDLRVVDCPPRSAQFHVTRGQLLVEAQVAVKVATRKGEVVRLVAGSAHRLARGDVVHLGRARISVVVGGLSYAGTTVGQGAAAEAPQDVTSVRLALLPRGGRMSITFAGEPIVAYLAGRRCALAACLLQPPAPYAPGDPIPDDVVVAQVWPDGTSARSAVGVVLHRLRRDLEHAGLDGSAFVERAEGGGATRFVVPSSAEIRVES